MAEVTNELMFSVLQKIQDDVSALRHDVREVKAELSALRGHVQAEQQDINNIYGVLARNDVRLDRIERRLELRTEPAL